MHPFRFAAMTNGGPSRKALEESARKAEDLGYHAFHVNDHYPGPGPAMEAANHAPQQAAAIPAALVIADATTTLRVGFRMLCVDYHNPVVLAKTLATLDQYSDGRIEIGLGAGWIEAEYEAMGVRYDKPSVRIARLGEIVDVLRASFAPGLVSVDGEHLQIGGFEGIPKSVQQPSPPIAIGGSGRKILQMAARKADIVCLNTDNRDGKVSAQSTSGAGSAAALEKVGWIKEAAGNRFEQLVLEVGAYFLSITDDTAAATAKWATRLNLPPEEVADHSLALIGSVDAICDKLEERRERFGWSYFTVLEHNIETFAPIVERLSAR